MPRLSVDGQEILPSTPAARGPSPKHRRRLGVFRLFISAVMVALTVWLASVAAAPATGPIAKVLLLVIASLLPVHLAFWQLGGIKMIDRRGLPKKLRGAIALLALAASPLVLYPLGLIALLVSLFAGGAATPALAVTGTLMLSPIIAILAIAALFILGSRKGR